MNEKILKVNGNPIPEPTSMSWGLQDISNDKAGRTEDTKMHKKRIGQKRKIELSWHNISKEQAAEILQAFNPEYIDVTYPDPMSGNDETREFYVGDRTAPFKLWSVGQKIFSEVSFNIIER